MRIDPYTKAVLTVIALALVWIAAGGAGPAVEAQDRTPQRVIVVGWEAGGALGARALPIPVRVAGWVDRAGTDYALPGPVQKEIALERGMGVPASTDDRGSRTLP